MRCKRDHPKITRYNCSARLNTNGIDDVVGKIVNCHNCALCCKNSSAFILAYEVDRLKVLKVPLYRMGGIYWIKPQSDGRCPKLSEDNKCEIYENRPLACRLFPFYVMNRTDIDKRWVQYQICPPINRRQPEMGNQLSLSWLRLITFELEKCLLPELIVEMLKCDKVISQVDRLEIGSRDFIQIMPIRWNTQST
jgi:Fe-S-cluster containining protein